MEADPSSIPRSDENCMHKNHLQEYAQRLAIPLPLYQTFGKGPPHAPQFRSMVMVDGMTFSSSQTFSSRKEAEQNVAMHALKFISGKIQIEGCPLIHADTPFCKSILYEYAVKMNLEQPTYTCSLVEGCIPTFISSVLFAGKMYKGINGRNKKEAQQLGAHAVIEAILGDSNSSTRDCMSQIIKSKRKLYAPISPVSNYNILPVMHLASEGNPEDLFVKSSVSGKEVQSALANERALVAGHVLAAPSMQISETCPTHVEGMKSKECIHEVNCGSIGNGTPLAHQPQDGQQTTVVSLSSDAVLDGSHLKFCSAVKIETSECVPTKYSLGEPLGLSTSSQVGPSRLSSGTQEMSSNSRKKRPKKGKHKCKESKPKKSRSHGVACPDAPVDENVHSKT